MKTLAVMLSLSTALIVAGVRAEGTDAPESGRHLHDQHCVACHDSSVYTRPNHRVTSRAGLESQVRRCEHNLSLQWFDDDIERVVQFLDEEYYHFGKK